METQTCVLRTTSNEGCFLGGAESCVEKSMGNYEVRVPKRMGHMVRGATILGVVAKKILNSWETLPVTRRARRVRHRLDMAP